MQAGRLRHRLIIQNAEIEELPSGQQKEIWLDGAEVWADVRGISGRELMSSGAELSDATIRVWLRFRQDIFATSRFKIIMGPFKGNILQVIGPPIPDAKATRLEVLCKTGVKV
ncbi:phage head closure protein [Serratia sarumanii]|uniref:phage head closure protein n=1 Tax=Serratia TaxID=613 RepID=UPI000931A7D6|nr:MULTISPECIES: phage head closure protein [Serratia]EJD6704351.1 phage head closure protein [Serratia marcescens]MBH3247333.1 phage head closure protein [Serratia marcescens]MDU3788602.1 phage head closure protein [Serratia marcescens]MDU3852638.1 phage head closure protein [Serratia marcescens]HBU6102876.1 phage head closure protein [Serratia marcescens]